MKQPEFTWWPWKILSVTVPWVALAALALADREFESNPRLNLREGITQLLCVFFGILGAGNGYLFALAVGDFGRSIIAIPVGALAGFVAVHVLSYPLCAAAFLLLLLMLVLRSLFQHGSVSGFLSLVGVGLSLMFSVLGAAHSSDPMFAMLPAFPFVCGCVTATMPVERTLAGHWNACVTGMGAALSSLTLGLGIYFLGMVALFLCGALLVRFLPLGSLPDAVIVVGSLGSFCALVNYLCVRELFISVYRTGPEVQAASVRKPGRNDGSGVAENEV